MSHSRLLKFLFIQISLIIMNKELMSYKIKNKFIKIVLLKYKEERIILLYKTLNKTLYHHIKMIY